MHYAARTVCTSGHCDERFLSNPLFPAETQEESFSLRNSWRFLFDTTREVLLNANDVSQIIGEGWHFRNVCPIPRAPRTPRDNPAGIGPRISGGLPEMPEGVVSVGVELECLVPNGHVQTVDRWVSSCPNGRVTADGSIERESGYQTREYTFYSQNLTEVKTWLSTMFGAGRVKTNESCGMHVHVKPTAALRWVYATRHYWQGFASAYDAFAERQERRADYRERTAAYYCRRHRWGRSYIRGLIEGNEERYTEINLQSLIKHGFGTIEHRILPGARSGAEATGAVDWLTHTASALSATPRIPLGPRETEAILHLDPLFDGETVAERVPLIEAKLSRYEVLERSLIEPTDAEEGLLESVRNEAAITAGLTATDAEE